MLRRRLPPVTRVALAFAVAAALPQYGVTPPGWALLVGAALLLPIGPFHRPERPARPLLFSLGLALAAGLLHGQVAASRHHDDCRWHHAQGPLGVSGTVVRSEGAGRIRVRPRGTCPGVVRVRLPRADSAAAAATPGMRIRVEGWWRPGAPRRPGLDPLWAGRLEAKTVGVEGPAPGLSALLHRHRDRLARRLALRFQREPALVQALVVARRGELDDATRTAFVRAGTAHLLAISGFHVGLLAGLVIWGLGRVTSRRRATLAGAVLAWSYVALLGFPDAATRAALLLTLLAVGRLLGRPVRPAGALGTALLLLTVVDPAMAGRVGAQLSFAGALGLAVAAGPVSRGLGDALARHRGGPPGRRTAGVLDAVGGGVVATAATLPLVAWHFEQVSLVSIPATVVATPLVALALPAVVATLALDLLPLPGLSGAAGLLATGAEGLLGAARIAVAAFAAPEWAALPVPRQSVLHAAVGAAIVAGGVLAPVLRVGVAVRCAALVCGVATGLVVGPVVTTGASGEAVLHMLDAGQGDALALRTPAGRWVVVDAGPPDGERVARALARLGVRRIELLVLTHPDADHVGGLPLLLRRFQVLRVAGPGTLRDGGAWREALALARGAGVPWSVIARGVAWELDGMAFRTLHPDGHQGPVADDDPNDRSVVLHVSWQGVDLLLTGDAPEAAEAAFAAAAGEVEILKVGHHGSRTSTGERLLARSRPRVALIPVGRGNRYGHPHPVVTGRLARAGVEVWRTDLHGAVRVRIDRRGRWRVEAERGRPGTGRADSDAFGTNVRR